VTSFPTKRIVALKNEDKYVRWVGGVFCRSAIVMSESNGCKQGSLAVVRIGRSFALGMFNLLLTVAQRLRAAVVGDKWRALFSAP